MVFRFILVSNEVDDFRRDIEIDATATFKDLDNAILDSVNYASNSITSFDLCDNKWGKIAEIALFDDAPRMDTDVYLMHKTVLSDMLTDEGQKLLYTFDIIGDRKFHIELREIRIKEHLSQAQTTKSLGVPPPQESDLIFQFEESNSTSPTLSTPEPEFMEDEIESWSLEEDFLDDSYSIEEY